MRDLTIKNYAKFMFDLFNYYKLKPLTKKSKEKIEIINGMNKELDNFTNVVYSYVNAPHQMERVLPITLSNIITKRKPKNYKD